MRVHILSQRQFNRDLFYQNINDETVDKFPEFIFISIIGSCASEKHYFQEIHSNVLNLVFDDISQEEAERCIAGGYKEPITVFSQDHANQIYQFLENYKNKKLTACFVHCAAGIARSGAVGSFVNDFFGIEDYFTFKRRNPNIQPNPYIISLLNRRLYER